jgi:hypothetical protein
MSSIYYNYDQCSAIDQMADMLIGMGADQHYARITATARMNACLKAADRLRDLNDKQIAKQWDLQQREHTACMAAVCEQDKHTAVQLAQREMVNQVNHRAAERVERERLEQNDIVYAERVEREQNDIVHAERVERERLEQNDIVYAERVEREQNDIVYAERVERERLEQNDIVYAERVEREQREQNDIVHAEHLRLIEEELSIVESHAAAQPSEYLGQWSCMVCTYINLAAGSVCLVCEHTRPEQKEEEGKHDD